MADPMDGDFTAMGSYIDCCTQLTAFIENERGAKTLNEKE
jgi:hypothetical protein